MKNSRYKRDSLAQAWIDRRDLATLVDGMTRLELMPLHMSDVIRYAVKETLKTLITKGITKYIQLTDDADTILRRTLRVNLNPGGKGLGNTRYNLELDEMRLAGLDSIRKRSVAVAQMEAEESDIGAETEIGLEERAQLLLNAKIAPNLEAAMSMAREHEKSTNDAEKTKEAREAIGETEKVE